MTTPTTTTTTTTTTLAKHSSHTSHTPFSKGSSKRQQNRQQSSEPRAHGHHDAHPPYPTSLRSPHPLTRRNLPPHNLGTDPPNLNTYPLAIDAENSPLFASVFSQDAFANYTSPLTNLQGLGAVCDSFARVRRGPSDSTPARHLRHRHRPQREDRQ